jgi:GAF domain-containing protein
MNRDGLATPDKLSQGILTIEDLDHLPELTSVHESLKAEGLRSCVCLPLKAKNVLLGSLNLWSDRPGGVSQAQIIIAEKWLTLWPSPFNKPDSVKP